MNISIITARGGSKGLPRKNIQEIFGRPLLAWSIKAAQDSITVDRVYVSTEDSEIADISRSYGAEIIERPLALAQDDTGSEAVIEHALEGLAKSTLTIDNVCLLQPTSPLRTGKHIDEAFEVMVSKHANCVISVFEPRHSAAKAYKLNSDGSITGLLFDDAPYTPRQNLVETYQPNGAVYWFDANQFMIDGKIPRCSVYPYVMSEVDSVDIDTIEDFEKAEWLLKVRNTQSEASS